MLLVVGASGHVGRRIVSAALDAGTEVAALCHSRTIRSATGLTVLQGDARRLDLGLDPQIADELRRSVRHVVIASGPPDVSSSYARLSATHTRIARAIVGFARMCGALDSLTLVSTVLAPGVQAGRLRSNDLPSRPRHRSAYEVVKHEVEVLVRESGLPFRIVRAGQVVGSSDGTAQPDRPMGMFAALPAIVRGAPIPLDPTIRYWITPVDLLATICISTHGTRAEGWSVWAVDPGSPRSGQVIDALACRVGGRIRLLPGSPLVRTAAAVIGRRSKVWSELVPLLPYAAANIELDLTCLRQLVVDSGLQLPSSLQYLECTIDHEVGRLRSLSA